MRARPPWWHISIDHVLTLYLFLVWSTFVRAGGPFWPTVALCLVATVSVVLVLHATRPRRPKAPYPLYDPEADRVAKREARCLLAAVDRS
jgi:hypothetical protein